MSTSLPIDSALPANRLAHSTSPYLQQHAHNPVDWFEWGPEALERARRDNKPIFLSIGYSACHWCHVMAHESFENPDIAAVMNRHFVNVKVDREERPDLDEIYMQATMLFNQGQGGWPMSVWLTPDLKPFYAGTYFPPQSRWNRPGFKELCERIGELWGARHGELMQSADEAASLLQRSLTAGSQDETGAVPALSLEHLDYTVQLLARLFDAEKGGISGGGTNKFPPSMAMDLMLRWHRRTARVADPTGELARRRDTVLNRVTVTLDRMAAGGIYDHLGGGICRYSTDVDWLVPHFEKMLYDQALVSRIYLDGHLATRKPLYARIAREVFDYVIGDLQSPEGGFFSTRDADSQGVEGKYYVWTRTEVLEALGKEDGALFCSFYDVSDAGNWDDPHAPGVAKNVLHVAHDLETCARLNNIEPAELDRRLSRSRSRLLDVRSMRVAPQRDEKILAEWNGLMIASLARGSAVLNDRRFADAAVRAAEFILSKQYRNGRLHRSYRDGRTLEMAFLTDYACMIEGLIELYEATFEKRWLDAALELNATAIRLFHDENAGGFHFTASDHERLIARTKDVRDSAVPSGNSVHLMNLLRLSVMTGDGSLRKLAERSMQCFAATVLSGPAASERFLSAVEFALSGPVEVAIVGNPDDPRTTALLRTIHETYLPNRVLMLSSPDRPDGAPLSPLLQNRSLVSGAPAAFVCRNYACKRPATTPEQLAAQLRE